MILALGVTYELLEHALKHNMPKNFKAVVDAMLAELSALGFVATATYFLTHQEDLLQRLAKEMGGTFHHLLHEYEALHFGLFFVVNFYFVQVMYVVWTITTKHSRFKAASLVVARTKHMQTECEITEGGLADPLNNWEDPAIRLALLQCMASHQSGTGLDGLGQMLAPSYPGDPDPAPWSGWVWGSVYCCRLLLTGWHTTYKQRLSELFLFREAMRMHLSEWTKTANWATHEADRHSNVGLPFLEYMEQSVSAVLGRLVKIEVLDWVWVWTALTAFTMLKRWLQAQGYSNHEAKAMVYGLAQLILLSAALFLWVYLAWIKEMIRPRLSAEAWQLLKTYQRTKEVPSTDRVLWDSGSLLQQAPYAALAAGEAELGPSAVARDWLRWLLRCQKPRRVRRGGRKHVVQQELLFGVLGASGPAWLIFLVQYVFLGSTLLVAVNLAVVEHELLAGLLGPHLFSRIFGEAVDGWERWLVRAVSLLPYAIVFNMMPGLVYKLTLVCECQDLLKDRRIKACVLARERLHFVAALKALLHLLMLFRNGKNNLHAKVATLKARPEAERLPAEVEDELLSEHSHEELGLLRASFLRGVPGGESEHFHDEGYTIDRRHTSTALKNMGLGNLSADDTDALFAFMDRHKTGQVTFNDFAATILLPIATCGGSGGLHRQSSSMSNWQKMKEQSGKWKLMQEGSSGEGGGDHSCCTNNIADEASDHFFRVLDQDGDGNVSFKEFHAVMAEVVVP